MRFAPLPDTTGAQDAMTAVVASKGQACDSTARDDEATLAAAGIIAYAAETMLHEAVGHGALCLLAGKRFTLLAPLYMRCTVSGPALLAAGPVANFLAAIVAYAWLRWMPPRGRVVWLLIWLSFTFNALVACGYLAIGAVTGFGDWPALATTLNLPFWWRLVAVIVATLAYYGCLRMAALLFRLQAGGIDAVARFRGRAMVPAGAAAVLACLAEAAGGRVQVLPMLLALGCTLGVGFSLTSMIDVVATPTPTNLVSGPVGRSLLLIGTGVLVALSYIAIIGPGLVLQDNA